MNMLGGNLEAMGDLASGFGSAGGDFDTQLTSIAKKADEARERFVNAMRDLKAEGEQLVAEMSEEVGSLGSQVADTKWTGQNKLTLDGLFDDMKTSIGQSQDKIVGFIGEAEGVVNGSLSQNLNSLQENATKFGSSARTTAESFAKSVTSQQQAFDQVLNG